MSDELIVRHCSPTLAGLKTGNLFSYKVESVAELKSKIEYMNNMLNSKGVYVYLLKLWAERALIYVFRPSKLIRDLRCKEADELLNKTGYEGKSLYVIFNTCQNELKSVQNFLTKLVCF